MSEAGKIAEILGGTAAVVGAPFTGGTSLAAFAPLMMAGGAGMAGQGLSGLTSGGGAKPPPMAPMAPQAAPQGPQAPRVAPPPSAVTQVQTPSQIAGAGAGADPLQALIEHLRRRATG